MYEQDKLKRYRDLGVAKTAAEVDKLTSIATRMVEAGMPRAVLEDLIAALGITDSQSTRGGDSDD